MDGNIRSTSAASCSVPTRLDLSSISATLSALQSRLSPGESVLLELDKHPTLTPLLAAWLLAFRRLLGTRRRVALAPVSAADDETVRKLALYELFELYPSAEAARRALRVTA